MDWLTSFDITDRVLSTACQSQTIIKRRFHLRRQTATKANIRAASDFQFYLYSPVTRTGKHVTAISVDVIKYRYPTYINVRRKNCFSFLDLVHHH